MNNNTPQKKYNHPHYRPRLYSKILLVIFGLLLGIIILEIGLRISGYIILSSQEYRNLQLLNRKGSYRILCLGESTTQGAYPHFLEEALNQRNIGIRFSVIDKGKAATNTAAILEQVGPYLDKYHPDMVIAMMGINDYGPHMPHDRASSSKALRFLKSCRTYKLIRLICMHIMAKIKELGLQSRNSNMFSLKIAFAQTAERNDDEYVDLGLSYRNKGDLREAEECWQKALELNARNERAYFELGMLYKDQAERGKAEWYLKKSLELNPNNETACMELRWLCDGPEAFRQIEGYLKKALDLNPANDRALVELGLLYRDHGDYRQAEDCWCRAMVVNPANEHAYLYLGWMYFDHKKLSEAKGCLKKGLESCPEKERLYSALSVICDEQQCIPEGREYFLKARAAEGEFLDAQTVRNYRRLRGILRKRNIRLVCVQYPMRSVKTLKAIFQDDAQGIVFVDNESLFRKAVRQDGYRLYFTDMFGGDFGHCTDKGNRLLAVNIADAILKEVFHK